MSVTLPLRSEIPERYTWHSKTVFADYDAWQREFHQVLTDLKQFELFRGRLGENPKVLLEALEAFQALSARVQKVYTYASISHAVDTHDSQAASMFGQASSLVGESGAAFAFIEPELISIGRAQLEQWMQSESLLCTYSHFLDNLFRKQPHIRSAEVEEILGMLADPFSGAYTGHLSLFDADMKFPPAVDSNGNEHTLAQGTIYTLLDEPDRELRRSAWQNYRDMYLAFKNTAASQLATSVKQNVFLMKARRFESTLQMMLDDQNIPMEVFWNLLATFERNLPIWHRYWRIRRKALGLETMRTYDIWAPLTSGFSEIPFEKAVDWICAGLAPMGEEYVSLVRRGCLEERWIDLMPSVGKTEGAFSSGSPGTYPFIVMSYNSNVQSLSTLAHELGHSMHSYYTWKHQPVIYSSYGMFAAEVASNFHQALVRGYMLSQNIDHRLRLEILQEAMMNFHRYFFIMPTLARFEVEVHRRGERGDALTADSLIELCAKLFADGYGSEVELDPQRDGITWATFGHLFADYYVFQYATGISGAHALARRILDGEPGAVSDYLNFLRAGNSKYPLDALKEAGVDLSKPEPVQAAFDVLASYVDQLEELVT